MTFRLNDSNQIMVVATGAYGNIGDAIIRRRIVNWVADLGDIHVYVGNGDGEWLEQLNLKRDAKIYSAVRKRQWLMLPFQRQPVRALVFDPGAIPLGRSALITESIYVLLSILVKLRGGVVIRPPRGVKPGHSLTLFVHRLGVRLSDITLWRTRASLDLVGIGTLCPDTAFQEEKDWKNAVDAHRAYFGISLRGKNPFPSDDWFVQMQEIIRVYELTPVIFSQVREDENRSEELAARLGAQHLTWGTISEAEQEERLRDLYKKCTVVVSDRLHVLILAALGGAVPLEITDSPGEKITDHFAQIGIYGLSIPVSRLRESSSGIDLYSLIEDRDDLRRRIEDASAELDLMQSRVRAKIA